jgi:heme exporter protein A
MNLLELHNVVKSFGGRAVLKGVALALARGTVTLLLGENGAGKSTLIKLAAGLLRPTAGSRVCRATEGRTAYLGHAGFVYPGLTALENLAFWRDASGLGGDEGTLMDALGRVGLERHAHERAGIFSRGMAQRLSLARTLLFDPELLLLDEPGTGLDARAGAMLRREIARTRERGAAVLWISHDAATDAPLADRVFVLSGGRLNAAEAGKSC